MKNLLTRIRQDEEGASMVEYVVLLGLITAAAIAVIGSIGANATGVFGAINALLAAIPGA
jgi:Flp pilus assembly pilin Flp